MKIEYNNLYIHYILITQNRYPFIIQGDTRVRIEKYINGIVSNIASKLYAIYANSEHIHFLVSRYLKISEEALLTKVAESSVSFINENKLCKDSFSWQGSAAAFSVSKSDVDKVCKYILNQPEHHKKATFQKEYDECIKFYQQTLKWEI